MKKLSINKLPGATWHLNVARTEMLKMCQKKLHVNLRNYVELTGLVKKYKKLPLLVPVFAIDNKDRTMRAYRSIHGVVICFTDYGTGHIYSVYESREHRLLEEEADERDPLRVASVPFGYQDLTSVGKANYTVLDDWLDKFRIDGIRFVSRNNIRQRGPTAIRSKEKLDAALEVLMGAGRISLIKLDGTMQIELLTK